MFQQFMILILYKNKHLQSLTKPHIITKRPIEIVPGQESQPSNPLNLIVPQLYLLAQLNPNLIIKLGSILKILNKLYALR
jgi:hypothetical protein